MFCLEISPFDSRNVLSGEPNRLRDSQVLRAFTGHLVETASHWKHFHPVWSHSISRTGREWRVRRHEGLRGQRGSDRFGPTDPGVARRPVALSMRFGHLRQFNCGSPVLPTGILLSNWISLISLIFIWSQAIIVNPCNGLPFNQLGTLIGHDDSRGLEAIFYYVRR